MLLASIGKNIGKVRFPYRLCEGEILFPLMDTTSKVLENLTTSHPQLPISYQRLSSDPPPVGKEIDLYSSLTHPSLPEPNSIVFIPYQPLVEESVNLVSPPVAHVVPEVHNGHIAYVLLVSSDSHESKDGSPILTTHESPSSILAAHGGNHTICPPSSFVISFDCSYLTTFCLPSYVPF